MILFGAVASGSLKSFIATISIAGTGVNLKTLADAAGFNGQKVVELTLTGVAYAASTAVVALDTGTWPGGTKLIVHWASGSSAIGYAGVGGGGGVGNGTKTGRAGAAGGPSVRVTPITSGSVMFIAEGGAIYGGGGGGGGGGGASLSVTGPQDTFTYYVNGGAGGRGRGTQGVAVGGSAGSSSNGAIGGTGGTGGGYGAKGGNGASSSGGSSNGAGGAGGAGGASILDSANVTLSGFAQGTNLFGYLG